MDKDQILLLNKAVRAFRDIGSPYVGGVPCLGLANLLVAMEREIKVLQKERDAAVEVLKQFECNLCIHENVGAGDEPCVNCIHNYAFRVKGSLVDNWQWRGPQEVN